MFKYSFSIVLLCLFASLTAQEAQYFREVSIFENGKEGYACFRIPAIISAPNGDLLAFAEGRVNGCNDFGNLDIVMKRSTDNGHTWTKPVNITLSVHRPNQPDINPRYNFSDDWRSYANTPGHAIQLKKGDYAGRIFIPANHSAGEPLDHFNEYNAHAFYSDDHGKTWKLSESVDIPSSNESIAVELSDGTVMQNIRHQNGESRNRIVALSKDGGVTWDSTYFDEQLISPVCQASILDYVSPTGKRALLFSNPASKTKREKMTVKMSFDEGITWSLSRQIRSGESAYSDLVIQKDQNIGLLYEHGNNGGIHYAHFNYYWLIGDQNHTRN